MVFTNFDESVWILVVCGWVTLAFAAGCGSGVIEFTFLFKSRTNLTRSDRFILGLFSPSVGTDDLDAVLSEVLVIVSFGFEAFLLEESCNKTRGGFEDSLSFGRILV